MCLHLSLSLSLPTDTNIIIIITHIICICRDEFVNGTDAQRNARLKFIPNIIEGNWAVTRAVGMYMSLSHTFSYIYALRDIRVIIMGY